MNKLSSFHFHRTPALAIALLAVLAASLTLTACQDDKVEAPDLKAEVAFIGDTLRVANATTEDWADVNVMIDDEFAYHVDAIAAGSTEDIDLAMFENEDNIHFPAGIREPQTVLIDCDMGQYWGDFHQ